MSYKFPSAKAPRQVQHHPLPPVQTYYPLSLADAPTTTTTALARPSTGWDLRTLLLLLAAAAFGMWMYNRFFNTKKKATRNGNEPLYFTAGGPLRGLDRVGKRIKQHAQLFEKDGYEGASNDLKEAADLIEEFTRKTRQQPLEG